MLINQQINPVPSNTNIKEQNNSNINFIDDNSKSNNFSSSESRSQSVAPTFSQSNSQTVNSQNEVSSYENLSSTQTYDNQNINRQTTVSSTSQNVKPINTDENISNSQNIVYKNNSKEFTVTETCNKEDRNIENIKPVSSVPNRSFGVDVSNYQSTDMSEYAKNGAKFAIVKLSEGLDGCNQYAAGQIQSAEANNMQVQGYHYAHFGGNQDEAHKEATHAVANAQYYGLPKGSYLALDYEESASENNNANTQAAIAFMDDVLKNGYIPLLYSNVTYLQVNFNLSEILKKFPNSLWIASYPESGAVNQPDLNYLPSIEGVAIWQYTDNWKGMKVDGDINVLPLNDNSNEELKKEISVTINYVDKNSNTIIGESKQKCLSGNTIDVSQFVPNGYKVVPNYKGKSNINADSGKVTLTVPVEKIETVSSQFSNISQGNNIFVSQEASSNSFSLSQSNSNFDSYSGINMNKQDTNIMFDKISNQNINDSQSLNTDQFNQKNNLNTQYKSAYKSSTLNEKMSPLSESPYIQMFILEGNNLKNMENNFNTKIQNRVELSEKTINQHDSLFNSNENEIENKNRLLPETNYENTDLINLTVLVMFVLGLKSIFEKDKKK